MTKNHNDIIKRFATATKKKDFETIENLLDDNGEFEIQNSELELVDRSKNEFLSWYKKKLNGIIINEIQYDQCVGCSFGNHVILFNLGYFPRIQKDSSYRSKAGFMIKSKEGKIYKLYFCTVFLKTDNKYIYECVGQIIKQEMKKGTSEVEAAKKFIENPLYNYLRVDSVIENKVKKSNKTSNSTNQIKLNFDDID